MTCRYVHAYPAKNGSLQGRTYPRFFYIDQFWQF